MRVAELIGCKKFPCVDIIKASYQLPNIEINPEKVKVVMISEASPENWDDYYYAPGNPAYQQTTVLAFQDAGIDVVSVQDILDLGFYLTTAVKCAKTGYAIRSETVKECSQFLEQELALFSNVQAIMLMGDVAIKALNTIAIRKGKIRVIPAISTYKLRGQEFYFNGARVFPSYLQVGPSFNIEKSKRQMIAEVIAKVMQLI